MLIPLVLLYFVLVRSMEERLKRDQRAAIEHGLAMLHDRKEIYKQNGFSYYRPCALPGQWLPQGAVGVGQ